MIPPLRAVLFDMDGTLLDTERIGAASWDHAAEDVGVAVAAPLKRSMVGRTLPDIQSLVRAAIPGENADRLLERAEHHYHRLIAEEAPPLKPGALELLTWLHERQVPLALATSSRAYQAEDKLSRAGIRSFFGFLVAGDQVRRGKPDPEIFQLAAEGLGHAAEHCVVFEDSGPGIEAAHRSGALAVLVPETWPPDPAHALFAHHLLPSLHQAPSLLAPLLAPSVFGSL